MSAANSTGRTFRLLNVDDTISDGDECISDDTLTWHRINAGGTIGESWMVGMKYRNGIFMPMRREVEHNNDSLRT